MRALWRHCLSPVVIAAAVLSATAPAAYLAAASPAHPAAAVFRGCPEGTNWDHVTLTCH